MTALRSPVYRTTLLPRGPVTVALLPEGLIAFREKRRRTWFTLPLASVFVRAVDAEVQRRKAEKRAARKAARS